MHFGLIAHISYLVSYALLISFVVSGGWGGVALIKVERIKIKCPLHLPEQQQEQRRLSVCLILYTQCVHIFQFINFVCINLVPYLFNLSLCCLLLLLLQR